MTFCASAVAVSGASPTTPRATTLAATTLPATPAARPWLVGGDVSMLPELEKAGATYSADGVPGDAMGILRSAGANVFRVRVFVSPSKDFNGTWGAVQDLGSMVELGRRIKASGAQLLVDLHYSDRWADPKHQTKPAAWEGLSFEQLEAKVGSYTAEVLEAFEAGGARPDYVQVGNEIAPGMLWPDGKLDGEDPAAWDRLARLVNAGCRAVRAFSTEQKPVRTVIHVHGGGTPGLPQWFFSRLLPRCPEVDVLGVSFYPTYDDTFDGLRRNLSELIERHGKPVWVVETSYPHKPVDGLKLRHELPYETTPEGQAGFVRDLVRLVRELPDGKGMGVIWWYPEAREAGELHIYRDGAEALVDGKGRLLPAARLLLSRD